MVWVFIVSTRIVKIYVNKFNDGKIIELEKLTKEELILKCRISFFSNQEFEKFSTIKSNTFFKKLKK